METTSNKLAILAKIEGYNNFMDMIEENIMDSICPGICSNPWCDYTTSVEPDCDRGYCEECREKSVKSALVLAGIH